MQDNFYGGQSYYYDPRYEQQMMISAQKKSIKSLSVKIGICILTFLFSPYIASFLLSVTGTYNLYLSNLNFQYSVDLLLNVLALFVPFFIVYRKTDKHNRALIEESFEKPKSFLLSLSAVFFGLMLCFAGDYISYFISVIFEGFGITLTTTPEQVVPTSGSELFLFAFSIIIPPAIIEEFTMRAVTMQPLRKYGEVFAIITTAAVFGLMHRNAVQGIFAFIAGLVFGFITVSTNSVWPAVIVHALNNGFSVLTNVLNETDTDFAETFYSVAVAVIFILGLIFAVPFFMNSKRIKIKNMPMPLSTKEKLKSFFLNVPMVISILIMLFYTIFGDL